MAETIQNVTLASGVKEVNELVQTLGETEFLQVTRGDADSLTLIAIRKKDGVQLYNPKGDLDNYLTAPERRKGQANVTTLESFIALTNRYRDADSSMFCDPTFNAATLTAVLNYNRSGSEAAQRFGDHRVHYPFPYSEQWKTWTSVNGRWMKMVDFAQFMEDNVLDLIQPEAIDPKGGISQMLRMLDRQAGSPEQIIALSKGMKINVKKQLHQAIDLNSGEVQFQFDVANSNKDNLPVVAPGAFVISIPVFHQGDPLQLGVLFRYRAPENQGEALLFRCDLYRPDQVFEFALQEALDEAVKDTALPLYFGDPEV